VSISWLRDGHTSPGWLRRRKPPGNHAAVSPVRQIYQQPELTGRERSILRELTEHHAAFHASARVNGQILADLMRLDCPGIPDQLLAHYLLLVFDFAKDVSLLFESLDGDGPFRLLTDAIGLAALDLTALDRI